MTTQTESRLTRYAFALTVALYGAGAVGGLMVGSAMWPKATAAIAIPSIDIAALMSNVDGSKLPATEIADLF